MAEFYKKKKKVCQLCAGKPFEYKDVETIRHYISNDSKKMLPRKMTGTCAKHQRVVAREIKKARFMALIPYTR